MHTYIHSTNTFITQTTNQVNLNIVHTLKKVNIDSKMPKIDIFMEIVIRSKFYNNRYFILVLIRIWDI